MRVLLTERPRGRTARHLLPFAARALLLASLVALTSFAAPSAAAPQALTLSAYRTNVRLALGRVGEMAEVYGEQPDGDALKVMAERVSSYMPAREKVEWGGRIVEVDNSWLHEALESLVDEQDDEKKVAAGLSALAGRLRALEARLAEAEAAPTTPLDRDAERGRLNSILRRPEFERRGPRQQGAVQRMVEELLEWLASLLPRGMGGSPGGSPRVSNWILWAVGGLCLLVLSYVARLLWRRRRVKGKSPGRRRGARVVLGERVEAEQTATDLLDEAERLARAGEMRGAIRKAYVALLCELGDRGLVRLAQHMTNRDYLDAVRRAADPRLYTEMLPLTNDFELHWYGLRAASDADWQSFKTRCRTVLKESEA